MKKNGFIAMSLVYTFFLVFIAVLLSILTFYLDNNAIINKINNRIIIRYNEGLDGKRIQTLNSKGIVKKGDYITYETNNINYNTGTWSVLKGVADNLYIVSNFVVAYINASEYNLANIQGRFGPTFLNSTLADSIELLELGDLWSAATQTPIRKDNKEYHLWNISSQYFIKNGGNTNIVAPNCSCSGNYGGSYHTAYYANDIPKYLSIADWYTAFCKNYSMAKQNESILSNCPVRYLSYGLDATQKGGIRIVVKLKPNVVILGGNGNIGSPYRVGVFE